MEVGGANAVEVRGTVHQDFQKSDHAIIDRLKFLGRLGQVFQAFLLTEVLEVVRTGFDAAAKTPQAPEFRVQCSEETIGQEPGSFLNAEH